MGQQIVDWRVVDLPEVAEVATKAASKVAATFPGIVERGDLEQEILIWAATHPAEVRNYVAIEAIGLLYNRMVSRAHNEAEKLARYGNRVVPVTSFQDID